MRSRLENFLRGIDLTLAANPVIEAEWSITNERLNGRNGIKEEAEAIACEALKIDDYHTLKNPCKP